MKNITVLSIALVLLCGFKFGKEQPNCSDPQTIKNLKDILFDNVVEFKNPAVKRDEVLELSKESFINDISISDPINVGYDKESRKRACEGKILYHVNDGGKFSDAINTIEAAGITMNRSWVGLSKTMRKNFNENESRVEIPLSYTIQELENDNQSIVFYISSGELMGLHSAWYANHNQ